MKMTSHRNITQFIEKNVCRNVLDGLWTPNDNEEQSIEFIYTNSLMELQSNENVKESTNKTSKSFDQTVEGVKNFRKENSDEQPFLKTGQQEQLPRDCEVEKKEEPSVGIMADIDDIDYFDSDEELMEKNDVNYAEKDLQFIFDGVITKADSSEGRYSEGLDTYKNMPIYKRSIQKFASDNGFEIHDIIPDGNCMFRSLSDQFMINGCMGCSAEHLRYVAVQYLREHPFIEESHHRQSFLCKETWEDYLQRMSKDKEWGDHLVLQAVVDAFDIHITVINVFQYDVRRTILQPESNAKRRRIRIFLGHIGEFHYLSLRPRDWRHQWPFKSILCRILACSRHFSPSARLDIIRNKFGEIKAGKTLSEEEYTDRIGTHTENFHTNSTESTDCFEENHGDNMYLEIYSINESELQATSETTVSSLLDPMNIDDVTGIPFFHLSYIFKQLFLNRLINPYIGMNVPLLYHNVCIVFLGSNATGMDVYLKDISKLQEKRDFYNTHRQKQVLSAAICPKDILVKHNEGSRYPKVSFYADSSRTHSGYSHIKVPYNEVVTPGQEVVKRDNEIYLRDLNIPTAPPNLNLPKNISVKYISLLCDTFPPHAQVWMKRERQFSFPSERLVQRILSRRCLLIKKAHPQSRDPDIEWKYDFSLAEQEMFMTGLTEHQIYGFHVFKVLTENATFHMSQKLKYSHLIAVYFKALEDIPVELWETNVSGCLLFVTSSLVARLKARHLPHYFMSSFNLIESFSTEEINEICVNIECIRLFPLTVIQITAENHGYNFAENLIRMVLKDCKDFKENRDSITLFTEAFMPGTVGSMKVYTRLGFYNSALDIFRYLYEQMLFLRMSDGSCEIPSCLDTFEKILESFHQRSTRIILARLFDKKFATNILSKVVDKRATFAKDILPWKPYFQMEWMEIPKQMDTDLNSLADYFFSCSIKESDKRNRTLATVTLETAIACVQKSIEMDAINCDEIEDQSLKEEITAQKEQHLLVLRGKLREFYISLYDISLLFLTFSPLDKHMNEIEKLCIELPEMAHYAINMFTYLKNEEKANEYRQKIITKKDSDMITH